MSHSDPALRQEIVEKLEGKGCVVGASLGEVRDQLGIEASNTKFSKALRSLHYNREHGGMVDYHRVWPGDANAQARHHSVQLSH